MRALSRAGCDRWRDARGRGALPYYGRACRRALCRAPGPDRTPAAAMLTFSRFTRYFMEVAHWRSIRRAAEALHVSASAIDRQILKAEQELGVQLFERLPGGLRLTSAGELLLVDARRWEKSYRRTLEQFDELKGLRRGHVDIAMIDALGDGIVIEAVAQLLEAHPGITFSLQSEDNQKVADKVIAAEVDFGLLLDPVSGIDLDVVAFAEIPLGICMPPGHPLSARGSLQLTEVIDEYRLLLPAAPLIVNEHAKVVYQRQHIDTRRCIRCNDVRALRALVRQGVGVGLLSQLDVLPDLAEGRLAFVPLRAGLAKPMTLSLCVAPQRQLSRAAQTMLKALAPRVETILEPRPARSA
jgi:DNA-binding transcriptional LysR family regulator